MCDSNKGQAGALSQGELSTTDRRIIEAWRTMGFTIPAPELGREEIDDFARSLGEIYQRLGNRLACEGAGGRYG
jgi:hypothetical protein